MTHAVPKDELFCRLALRQGLLTEADAREVLERYRDEGKVSQGIGRFALREGYLEEGAVVALENAIAKRAEGHVTSSRRRVPRVGARGQGGRAPVHHRHHHQHPRGAPATPARMVLFAGGAIVFIVCIIFLLFKFTETTAPPAQEDPESGTPAVGASPESTRQHPALVDTKPPVVEFTEEELKNFRTRADRAITDARQMYLDNQFHAASLYLEKERQAIAADHAPPETYQAIEDEKKEVATLIEEIYQELLAEAKELKSSKDEAGLLDVFDRLDKSCGPELLEKAKAALQ